MSIHHHQQRINRNAGTANDNSHQKHVNSMPPQGNLKHQKPGGQKTRSIPAVNGLAKPTYWNMPVFRLPTITMLVREESAEHV